MWIFLRIMKTGALLSCALCSANDAQVAALPVGHLSCETRTTRCQPSSASHRPGCLSCQTAPGSISAEANKPITRQVHVSVPSMLPVGVISPFPLLSASSVCSKWRWDDIRLKYELTRSDSSVFPPRLHHDIIRRPPIKPRLRKSPGKGLDASARANGDIHEITPAPS